LLSRGGTVTHGQLVHYATSREGGDRLEVLELLLSRQAPGLNKIMYHDSPESFNMLKDFGLGTPLHLAAEKGHTDVVQYLLRKGVNPKTRDSCGRLALNRAQRNEHSNVVKLLRPFSTAN
jgi:ankyrin repeat protein